jgi:small acid-soluble spore protein D (minor alpha/beta-type SASP)
MARRRLLVSEARDAMERLKAEVMTENAGARRDRRPELAVKPPLPELPAKDGGDLTTREAGKIGGPIGGRMIQRLIELAKEELAGGQRPEP